MNRKISEPFNDSHLTREERQLARLMRLWSVLFGLMGMFFVVSPQIFTEFLNRFSHLISGNNFNTLPYPAERFWYSLTVSLMATITYLSFVASRDIQRNFHCVIAVLICKFTSTLFFLLSFATGLRSAGYLVSAPALGRPDLHCHPAFRPSGEEKQGDDRRPLTADRRQGHRKSEIASLTLAMTPLTTLE